MILSCLVKNQCVSGMEILCISRRMWLQDYKYEIIGKTFDGIIQIYICLMDEIFQRQMQ